MADDDAPHLPRVILVQEDTARWRSSGLHRAAVPEVMVLDDDSDTGELMRVVLESEGMAVRCFCRSDEAFAAIAERAPDVLLLDLHLAGERGEDVARQLRADAAHGDIRLIAITGSVLPERDRVRLFDAYLRKPVDTRLIVTLVRELATARRDAEARREPPTG